MSVALRVVTTVALACAAAWVFRHGEANGFVSYDDPIYVTDNPELELGLSAAGVRWSLTSYRGGNWHPVTWWTHLVDFERYGLADPAGHHRTSALIHAATSALLAWALVALGAAFWPSLWVAAFFALHPLRVESVTWVAERKDVVAAFFWVTTLLTYGLYCRKRSFARYAAVVVSFVLCLASKSMGVTLPFVFLLLDVWPARRTASESWRRLVLEKLPLLALSAATSVATYAAQAEYGSVGSMRGFPLDTRIANAALSYVEYLRQLAWPRDLACFYPHPAVIDATFSLTSPRVLGAFAVLAIVTAGAWWRRRRQPYLLAGWLVYLGTLVPAIGLLQVGIQGHADRYTYLPSIGIVIALVFAAAEAARASRGLAVLANAAGLALLALATRATLAQIETWRDSESLYRHAIRVTAKNYVALNNLGVLLAERGELEEAERMYRRALTHAPDSPDALANVAERLVERGEVAEARTLLERALERHPRHVSALCNRGVVHMRAGEDGEARDRFELALEVDPLHLDSLRNLGLLYVSAKNPSAARPYLETALEIAPDDVETTRLSAEAAFQEDRFDDARAGFQRAIDLGGDTADVRLRLADVARRTGDDTRAIAELEAALHLDPTNTFALVSLVDLHDARGEKDATLPYLERLVELVPDQPLYLTRLAWLLATTADDELRDPEKALEHADRAIELTEERDADSLAAKAACFAAMNKLRRAALWQRKAVEIAPAHMLPHLEANLETIESAQRASKSRPYRDRLR